MIYFISQSTKKFELSGNYAEFSSNTQVTHNLTHLPRPLKAQQNPHCLARPGADLLNTPEMKLLCAHMPEGTVLSIPSQLGSRLLSISCPRSHNSHSAPVQNGVSCACVCTSTVLWTSIIILRGYKNQSCL